MLGEAKRMAFGATTDAVRAAANVCADDGDAGWPVRAAPRFHVQAPVAAALERGSTPGNDRAVTDHPFGRCLSLAGEERDQMG